MTLRLRLLRVAAARPLLASGLAVAAAASVVAGVAATAAPRAEEAPAADPRLVLGRVWLDRYPEKRTDDVDLWIFLGGGIGIFEHGSVWRSSTDFFEFERQGDRLLIRFLHDKKKAETKFTITPCQDRPPEFDLCLTLDESPRGRKRYYSWGSEQEMERRLPWGRALLRAAESRAAGK